MNGQHKSSILSSDFDEEKLCFSKLKHLWHIMIEQACVCHDPLVKGLLTTGIRSHSDFASALAALLGRKLADHSIAIGALTELVRECFEAQPEIVCAAAADMLAIRERDPACPDYVTPFLFLRAFTRFRVIGSRIGCGLQNGII